MQLKVPHFVFVFFCTLFIVTNAGAQESLQKKSTDEPDVLEVRERQRALFLKAERRVWTMSDNEFEKTIDNLGDYPLIPYLQKIKLLHNLSLSKKAYVHNYLLAYQGTPLDRMVRKPWLEYLLKRNRKTQFLADYEPVYNTALTCKYLEFSYPKTTDKSELNRQIAELWNVGKSQPKACDPVFKQWIKNGNLEEGLVLHRIKKAATGQQHTLIPYLKTLLPSKLHYLADLWLQVRRNPAYVANTARFPNKFPLIESEIVTYGLGRLVWREEELALKTWEKITKKLSLSRQQQGEIAGKFAISLVISNHNNAEVWLSLANELYPQEDVLRWHLRWLLKQQNWPAIINLVEKAPPTLTGANEYRYWLARSFEQLGRQQKAEELYQQLAGERHYYGFLASARLKKDITLLNNPVVVESSEISRIASFPSARRAYELFKLKRYTQARKEWRFTQSLLSEQEKLISAVIADEWGWHDQSIFTFSRTGYLDDVDRRFPLAFSEVLTNQAENYNIPPEWAFAIARRESSFMVDAISTADARGLMQVLPSTAKYLEKKRVSSRSLFNPSINIKLGSKYLRYLMNKVEDNPLLATASYNAGWRRVKQWLPDDKPIDADVWIETIPYKETRNYVKAVMAYQQIYQAKKGDKQSTFNFLIDLEITPLS